MCDVKVIHGFYMPFPLPQDEEGRGEAVEWFEEGEKLGCPFSAYELWKITNQPLVRKQESGRRRKLFTFSPTSSLSSR